MQRDKFDPLQHLKKTEHTLHTRLIQHEKRYADCYKHNVDIVSFHLIVEQHMENKKLYKTAVRSRVRFIRGDKCPLLQIVAATSVVQQTDN